MSLKPPIPHKLEQVKVIRTIPTGCSHLDFYMEGQANQEMYGFLAPFGGGKTTQSVQLSVNRCQYELQRCRVIKSVNGRDVRPQIVYFVTYEEEQTSLIHRLLSFAALVDKNAIEQGRWKQMSQRALKNYKPYERELFPADFAERLPIPGERERLEKATLDLNRTLRIIDFTGKRPEFAEQAADFARGIAEVIEADQAEHDHPGVSMVVIDYAGAAADRHCEHGNHSPDRVMRHLIGRFPMRCKNHIAVPFDCPVWIMHQLSAKANERSPGQVPKPTDVAEAKKLLGEHDLWLHAGHQDEGPIGRRHKRQAAPLGGPPQPSGEDRWPVLQNSGHQQRLPHRQRQDCLGTRL